MNIHISIMPAQTVLSKYTDEELNHLDQVIIQAVTKELAPNEIILKLNSKVTYQQLFGNKCRTIVWWSRCNLPCVQPYRVCSSKMGQQLSTHLSPGKNDPSMAIKKFLEGATESNGKKILDCVICFDIFRR
jgi:hypothetical protein